MNNPKIWFITGASRGMGRIWAQAALKRGDKVAATARNVADVADFAEQFGDAVLPLALDVTNAEQVQSAVAQAHEHFGRLDVVINNAGYSLVGTVEEVKESDVQSEFDANFFGALRVIQAVTPILRAQGNGHILGVSSGLGIVAVPLIGLYCASKWAFEALHESLSKEVESFGIKVTIIEPGAYATEFGSDASLKQSEGMEVYAELRQNLMAGLKNQKRGNPQATPDAILQVVDAENPPLRLILGDQNLPEARAAYAKRIETWEAWADVSNAAQG